MKKKLLKFISVSMLNTFIGLSTILVLQELLRFDPYIANLCGYGVGYIISYILNKNWTFNSNAAHIKSLSLFLIASANAYFINIVILYGMLGLKFNGIFAQVCAVVAHGLAHFVAMNFLVFKAQRQT